MKKPFIWHNQDQAVYMRYSQTFEGRHVLLTEQESHIQELKDVTEKSFLSYETCGDATATVGEVEGKKQFSWVGEVGGIHAEGI